MTDVVEEHNETYDEVCDVFKDILLGIYGCPSDKNYRNLKLKEVNFHLAILASATPGPKIKYVS